MHPKSLRPNLCTEGSEPSVSGSRFEIRRDIDPTISDSTTPTVTGGSCDIRGTEPSDVGPQCTPGGNADRVSAGPSFWQACRA